MKIKKQKAQNINVKIINCLEATKIENKINHFKKN